LCESFMRLRTQYLVSLAHRAGRDCRRSRPLIERRSRIALEPEDVVPLRKPPPPAHTEEAPQRGCAHRSSIHRGAIADARAVAASSTSSLAWATAESVVSKPAIIRASSTARSSSATNTTPLVVT
jgi:hypothetical protein